MVRTISRLLAIVISLMGMGTGVLFVLMGFGKLEPQFADGFWSAMFALIGAAIAFVSTAFLWKLLRSFRYDRHSTANVAG